MRLHSPFETFPFMACPWRKAYPFKEASPSPSTGEGFPSFEVLLEVAFPFKETCPCPFIPFPFVAFLSEFAPSLDTEAIQPVAQ